MTERASVSLLVDGDLTLIISDDFYRRRSPAELEKDLQGLLKTIQDDIDFFSRFTRRLNRLVEWTILFPAFMLSIASTYASFMARVGNASWKPEPLQVVSMDCLALLLLVMGWFRKPIALALLRRVLQMPS